MAKYSLKRVGNAFIVMQAGRAVSTPAGSKFSSSSEQLATLLCEDMNQYGANPMATSSYVNLHASYLDMGRHVPKEMLAENILSGYTSEWDIVLMALDDFDADISSPVPTAASGFALDPMMYFGGIEEPMRISSWLQRLSQRALSSVQVCGGSFHSILLPYRLLEGNPSIPADCLAKGIIKCSDQLPGSLLVDDDPEATEQNIAVFLDKIRRYASFPDEND